MKAIIKYFAVAARVELREQMAYRANFFLGFAMIGVRILMLIALWNALYVGKTLVNGIDLPTMRFYTIASVIFEIFISANIEKDVSTKVSDGTISFMINRPLAYPTTIVLNQFAYTAQNIILRVIPYLAVLLATGIAAKAQVVLSAEFFLSVALSYILMMLYQMFFGFIAFWTIEISGFLQARDAIMLVFSGSMIPLWFFPDWLFSIAQFLPFQALFNTPLSILIGKISGEAVWTFIAIQCAWIVFFAALSILFWFKARKRVIVNGG